MIKNNLFIRLFPLVLVSLLHSGEINASCRGDIPFPVLSLSDSLIMVDPSGFEVGRAGYLEVLRAENFQSTKRSTLSSQAGVSVVTNEDVPVNVNADLVLTFSGRECISERVLMKDVPRDEFDLNNTLQAKAFIGIKSAHLEKKLDSDRASGGNSEIKGVPFRSTPSHSGNVLEYRKRYLLGYVYATHYDSEALEYWYFIGGDGDASFRMSKSGDLTSRVLDNMLGWVNQNDIVLWPQRQSIYPESAGSVPYITETVKGDGVKASIDWIDEAADERSQAVLKFFLLRENKDYGLYEVAYPQVASISQSSSNSQERPATGGTDDIRVILDRLRDSAMQVDLLFVLDNTESMEIYRDDVIKGISDLSEVPIANRESLQVGFAMFGDLFEDSSEAEAWAESKGGYEENWIEYMNQGGGSLFQFWMQDFDYPGRFPTLENLTDEFGGFYVDPKIDKPEMGLPALELATQTASWRPDSVRLVVYIGDDQSRVNVNDNIEAISERIAQSLKTHQAVLLPINVAGSSIEDNNIGWQEQIESIVKITKEINGPGGALPAVVAYRDPLRSDREKAREEVKNQLSALFVLQDTVSTGFNLDEICRVAKENNLSCNYPLELLQKFADASLSDLEKLQLRTDIINTGYYPAAESELFVALSLLERQGLENAISSVCVGLQDGGSMRSSMEKMAEELTAGFLGESRSLLDGGARNQESIPEFFARLSNLPAEYFSIFSDGSGPLTIDEFVDLVLDLEDEEEKYRELQHEMCLSAKLFEYVGTGVYANRAAFSSVYDDTFQAYDFTPVEELKRYDWRWGVGGGLKVFFVPQDFFPGNVITDVRSAK